MRTIVAIFVLICVAQAQDEIKPRMEEIHPQIVEPWQIACNEEVVTSNLELKNEQHIFGSLTDPSGSPLIQSQVLLRKQNGKGKFVEYRSALTDKGGRFELKFVGSGKYRFLPAPNRGWKQPKSVSCNERSNGECELNLVIALNPTDQPFAGCPIQ